MNCIQTHFVRKSHAILSLCCIETFVVIYLEYVLVSVVSAVIKREPLREQASLKTSDHNQTDKMFTDLRLKPPVPALNPASVRMPDAWRTFHWISWTSLRYTGNVPSVCVSNTWSSPPPEGRLPGAVASFSLSDHTDWSKWHNWLIQSPAGWKWPLSPRGFPDTLAHTNSRLNTPCICTFIPAAPGFAVHTHVQCSHRCSSIVAGFSER